MPALSVFGAGLRISWAAWLGVLRPLWPPGPGPKTMSFAFRALMGYIEGVHQPGASSLIVPPLSTELPFDLRGAPQSSQIG